MHQAPRAWKLYTRKEKLKIKFLKSFFSCLDGQLEIMKALKINLNQEENAHGL